MGEYINKFYKETGSVYPTIIGSETYSDADLEDDEKFIIKKQLQDFVQGIKGKVNNGKLV